MSCLRCTAPQSCHHWATQCEWSAQHQNNGKQAGCSYRRTSCLASEVSTFHLELQIYTHTCIHLQHPSFIHSLSQFERYICTYVHTYVCMYVQNFKVTQVLNIQMHKCIHTDTKWLPPSPSSLLSLPLLLTKFLAIACCRTHCCVPVSHRRRQVSRDPLHRYCLWAARTEVQCNTVNALFGRHIQYIMVVSTDIYTKLTSQ